MERIGNQTISGRWILPFLSFLFSFPLFASIVVKSQVSREVVLQGEPFQLSLQVQTQGDSVSIGEPKLPNLSDFEILGSWTSQSSSTRLAPGPNGMEFKRQKIYEYTYQLSAINSGGQTIGPIEIEVDNKIYKTNPIQMEVTQDPSQIAPPQGSSGGNLSDEAEDMLGALEDQFEQLLKRHQVDTHAPKIKPRNTNEAFFVYLSLDKSEAYVGEQITASWYLYTRGQILALDRLKFPDLKGFWKETIEEVPSLVFNSEELNGVLYKRALLASHALFPIKPGVSVIDEYKIKATVQLPRNGFGGFVFGEPYSFNRSSDRVTIKVKDLPTQNRPPSFSGAVGNFEVKAQVPNGQVPLNQPFALKITFQGEGNAKLIDLPEINWPQGIEYFDKKSEARFFKNGQSIREFEVLLIPRKPGPIEIPSLSFSFFNPNQSVYYEKSTESVKIEVVNDGSVSGSTNQDFSIGSNLSSSVVAQARFLPLPPVILNIKKSSINNAFTFSYLSPWLWLALLIFSILFFIKEFFWGIKKRGWKDYFQDRFKSMKKMKGESQKTDLVILISETLSQLVRGVGLDNKKIINGLKFEDLLKNLPPSLRETVGVDIMEFYTQLQFYAFSPEIDKKSFDSSEHIKKFQTLGTKILTYLEDK